MEKDFKLGMVSVPERWQLGRKIGAGTFSCIHEAYDQSLGIKVALKIEKKDKSHNIFHFEFNVLKMLQEGTQHIAKVFEYVKNPNADQNFIVMELLGPNLAKVKRACHNQRLPRI